MAPSTHIEFPPELEVEQPTTASTAAPVPEAPVKAIPRQPQAPSRITHEGEFGSFQSSMLEYNRMKSGNRLLDVVISLTFNTLLLAGPVFAGLFYTGNIPCCAAAPTATAATAGGCNKGGTPTQGL